MKKLILSAAVIASMLAASCGNDDDIIVEEPIVEEPTPEPEPEPETPETETAEGMITEDTTWTNDRIWILDGKVVVDGGATLTIEPGTIIKGEEGVQTEASALVVDTGAKLMAKGTADEPIIFTSILDNIEVGQTKGTNLDVDDRELWGGVIVLGLAPSSFRANAEQVRIEGLPEGSDYGLYGGDDPEDNSGHLEYISIRHGGAEIGEGNEINGLTLGGVGNGTTIKNIEVVANLDDAIEWFGGTVDSSNLIVWGHGDDGLDLDQAYSGTISNAVIIQTNVSDHAFEIDGPEGDYQDSYTIKDVTVFNDNSSEQNANTGGREFAQFRDGARGSMSNVLMVGGLPTATFNVRDDSEANYTAGELTFENLEIILPDNSNLEDIFTDGTGGTTFTADAANFVTELSSFGDASVGADLSVFAWSYTAQESNKF